AFIEKLIEFYHKLNNDEAPIYIPNNSKTKLETLIHHRVFIDDSIITKTFTKVLTNSLLFIDVLAFKMYIKNDEYPALHAKKLENIVINLTYHTLNSKEEKSLYDKQLVKLFESSISYNKEVIAFDGSYRDELNTNFNKYERKYFLDLACLDAWDDHSLEYKESEFIYGIGKDLRFDPEIITESINYVENFFEVHKDNLELLR